MNVKDYKETLEKKKEAAKQTEQKRSESKEKKVEVPDYELKPKFKIPDISEEEVNEYIDKYIMGEPINKEYNIRNKIKFTLREPKPTLMTDIEKSLYFDKKTIQTGTEFNNNLIGIYVSKYMDKNFEIEQGENYDTVKSVLARQEYYLSHLTMAVRSFIMDSIEKFQNILNYVFSNQALKNS